jgi:RNA polymerase sigma-70 factor (ECF subfamily)
MTGLAWTTEGDKVAGQQSTTHMNPSSFEDRPHVPTPFVTTQWSLVLKAGREDDEEAFEALGQLCRQYWPPLYAFVRRSGHTSEDAKDLTQSFFARLLSERRIGLADPERGRFRTFLLASMRRFMISEWRHATRMKRGGHVVHVPLEYSIEERLISNEPSTKETPETAYEKRWAMRILEQALERVHADYRRLGQEDLFGEMRHVILQRDHDQTYAELGRRLGMSETAFKVSVFRIRARFRQHVRAVVADTLPDSATAGEVDAELGHLLSVLREVPEGVFGTG